MSADDIAGLNQVIPAAEPEPQPPEPGSKGPHPAKANGHADPAIIKIIAGQRHHAANQGMAALVAGDAPFFQRDLKLVRVALVKAKNAEGGIFEVPGIVAVSPAILERALGQAATWSRYDGRKKKDVVIDPPAPVVRQILDMAGEWSFAPLTGIIQCPTLRRDGSLLATSGYDEMTGLVLVNSVKLPDIKEQPTREDAEAALADLDELLLEFPFVDDASRAVALSMILTPVLRAAIEVAPMHLATAPRPGTGKSYLADVSAMIATGDRCPVKAASPNPEETEKRLVGSALAGHPIIALDNCRDLLQGDFLCQITERPLLSLRALGKSDPYRIRNTFCFFANGNNVMVADDMVRRTIRSAMDANCEDPDKREFKAAPLDMIRRDRGKYVAAVLTIARAYITADRPGRLIPLPSFEDWSAMVREPLVWLGCADPISSMEALRAEDPKSTERSELFIAWKDRVGIGKNRAARTSELIDAAAGHTGLREALLAIATPRFGNGIDPKALGIWLATHENNIAVGCKLKIDRSDKARPKWFLELLNGE